MIAPLDLNGLSEIAPAGYYMAIRIGFAFPVEEINALPESWVQHYTSQRFMIFDPVTTWVYGHKGKIRWSEIDLNDARGVLSSAAEHGLKYGGVASYYDENTEGQRSFGSFVRDDREFTDDELDALYDFIKQKHIEMSPPSNITNAELEALARVRDGARLKEIAFELGVSEGAVKQRLKNAKKKLNAKTGSQAAALAAQYGLI